MNKKVISDLYRYTGKTSLASFVMCYVRVPSFRYTCALRLIQSHGIERKIGIVLWLFRDKKRIQIPKETQIGYGLYIGHNGPVVVSSSAVIGNNVNLSQYTTIGSNHGKAAIIGNGVYIGPNVCVVESVNIGVNVTIGAGSVVTKDIPKNATAAGNYARILNYNNPGRYIANRWNS